MITTDRIRAVIPPSTRSNHDRAELVALRRLGTVEDRAKVVEFLATDLSEYATGAVIPIDEDSQPSAFPMASGVSSIADQGIELSCNHTRLLPMPMKVNGDACYPPNSSCLGYTLRDTLSHTARIEKPQKS